MAFINFSELYAAGGTFDLQEVNDGGNITVVYGGYAPKPEPGNDTEACQTWLIRRLVVTESSNKQHVECTWARGSWTDRATLTYKFGKP